jgi:hypothetical protein
MGSVIGEYRRFTQTYLYVLCGLCGHIMGVITLERDISVARLVLNRIDALDSLGASTREAVTVKPAFVIRATAGPLDQYYAGPQAAGPKYQQRAFADLLWTHNQRKGMTMFTGNREPDIDWT